MTAPDLSWRKSTFSTNQTNCVEVAFAEPTAVAVRDSKNQDGPTLAVPAVTWHSFISRVGSR